MRRLVWLAVFIAPLGAWGQVAVPPPQLGLTEMVNAKNYGMGGAFLALGDGTESIDGNPAALSLQKQYLIELTGAWDVHTKYAFVSPSILDSTSGPIAAGLSYHLVTTGRGATQTTGNLTTLALAYPLSDNFHIGASVHHVLTTGAISGDGVTGDAGLAVRLFTGFVVAASAHNIIDIYNPLAPRYYALGLGYNSAPLMVAADFRTDWGDSSVTHYTYNAGAEYVLGDSFPLRAGYSFETTTHTNFLSAGLGFKLSGGGVDVAYRHELGGNQGRLHALSLRLQLGN
jgi:hypothetical protein